MINNLKNLTWYFFCKLWIIIIQTVYTFSCPGWNRLSETVCDFTIRITIHNKIIIKTMLWQILYVGWAIWGETPQAPLSVLDLKTKQTIVIISWFLWLCSCRKRTPMGLRNRRMRPQTSPSSHSSPRSNQEPKHAPTLPTPSPRCVSNPFDQVRTNLFVEKIILN